MKFEGSLLIPKASFGIRTSESDNYHDPVIQTLVEEVLHCPDKFRTFTSFLHQKSPIKRNLCKEQYATAPDQGTISITHPWTGRHLQTQWHGTLYTLFQIWVSY